MNQEKLSAHGPAAAPQAALYQQVKAHILSQIAAGTWRAGDRVPSEQALVHQFGVARMTVNRALRELAGQGSIVRMAGVGSFVAEEKRQSTLMHIANIAEEIQGRGHDHRFEQISCERVTAPLDVAASLQLQTGDSVFHLVGVHHEDGLPVQLEDRWVNPRMAPGFIDQDFRTQQPSDYLVRSVPLDEIEHVVDAILPTERQAALMQIAPSDPCLMLTRRTWTREQVVTLVRCLHPGARYRLGSRFRPAGLPSGI